MSPDVLFISTLLTFGTVLAGIVLYLIVQIDKAWDNSYGEDYEN